MKNTKKGFTLIELMIVVAIIAILAAIAIPAYQDYLIRSQVSEGATLAGGAETAVAEYYSNKGVFPSGNTSAGISGAASISGKYVSQVLVGATGKIGATFSNVAPQVANSSINGMILGFSPVSAVGAGSIAWHCNSGNGLTNVTAKYLPSSCRGTGQ